MRHLHRNIVLFLIAALIVLSSAVQPASAQQKPELPVRIGDKAPLFSAKTFGDEEIRLEDFIGEKNVVLYFYPKDDTPGCTTEACSFRDNMEQITSLNTVVLGVSVDDVSSHEDFKEKYELNFPLVSDADQKIVKMYGVARESRNDTIFANRVTFLIDKKGIIRHIWNPVKVEGHTEDVLKRIQELKLDK
ncbi:peroxiredoxin [candidate division KSB1 bacterium]